jgi:hypothetical protein
MQQDLAPSVTSTTAFVPVRGRPSRETRLEWVRHALRLIGDVASLDDTSPLARHPAVERLAATTFRGRTCPNGLALRALLRDALAAIGRDLDGTVVGALAVATLHGRTQASLAAELGMGQEWLSRRHKSTLVALVLARLDAAADTASTLPAAVERPA